jgi:(1->4)-alpha-D-glucan 1-alpha-D-glucosylmutase
MRIPIATYRIQFTPTFGFRTAREIIPYLAELGISDLYASPIFKARKGSDHGYDVVDLNELNPELGSTIEFEKLNAVARDRGMGWLQDMVPNHMAFDHENKMLMDILENGPNSRYFNHFDIDWDHPYESIRGKVLAPFLGRFYGESLEAGEVTLQYGAMGFTAHYYHLALPLKMESYLRLLTHRLGQLKIKLGEDHPEFIKLLGTLYVLRTLPSGSEQGERYDQVKFIKRTLWELYNNNADIKAFIDGNVKAFNGDTKNPESFKQLDDLLSEQWFRLAFWKVATEEINYRRFFNINELISLRVEDPDVLDQTHGLIFQLVREDKVSGLRIDHIDGLYDPTRYLERVRGMVGDMYITVEKICQAAEGLPSFWPVQGTTGYDFLNYLNGIFCVSHNAKYFSKVFSSFTGFQADYETLVADKKRLIMGRHMAGDIDNLALLLKGISSRHRYGSDITLYGLKRALVELMAHFPVYRTYISEQHIRQADVGYVKTAVDKAFKTNPGLLYELRFIERFLLFACEEDLSQEEKDQWIHFVMRFQQLTGPLMAKGFEDTTLYLYNRLISLNEVGGSPERFGVTCEEFHEFCVNRSSHWPHAMNATSTHDTKRGEDVRARINVLSEIPHEWERHLKAWSHINKKCKKRVDGLLVPDRNDEYFLYQTLIGSWPFDESALPAFISRVKDYTIKAIREAKVHTAWLKPDINYEGAFMSFIEEILRSKEENPFLKQWLPFQKKVAHFGIYNSLSQILLKVAAPGLPDFYQGTDLWDLNLVDPDNRRPVDFNKRNHWLGKIKDRSQSGVLRLIRELLRTRSDGRIKLFLTHRLLKARNAHRDLFQNGAYIPLVASGTFKNHLITFARKHGKMWAAAVAPRFLTAVVTEGKDPVGHEAWLDTRILLPADCPSVWRDMITDQIVECNDAFIVGDILKFFPNTMLLSEEKP